MAARQEDVNGAMLSILKKMDSMVSATQESYEESLITLGNVENIMKVDVGSELKKQTSLLSSIEAKLISGLKASADAAKGADEFDSKGVDAMSKSLVKMAKAAKMVSEKAGEKVKKFLGNIADAFADIQEKIDSKKAKEISNLIKTLAGSVLYFAGAMILATPFLVLSLLGSALLGLNIKILAKTAGEALDPEVLKGMASIIALGGQVFKYALGMVVVSLLAPFMLLGPIVLAKSITLLSKVGKVADKETTDGMMAVLGVGGSAIRYGLAMVVVSLLSPFMILGSVVLGLSVRLLTKIAGEASKDSKGLIAILGIGGTAIKYGLAMVVVTLLAPFMILGAVILGLSIRLLMKTAGTAKKDAAKGMAAIIGIGSSVLKYALGMVVVTLLAPFMIIGAVMLGLSVRILMAVSGTAKKEASKGMEALNKLGKGVLWYALSMVVVTLLSPIVLIGSAILALSLWVLSMGLRAIGSKKSRKGVRAMLLTALGIFAFALVIWAFNKMVKPMEALFTIAVIVGFALVFWFVGKMATNIFKGALAMIVVGVAVILLAVGLLIFKAANFGLMDALTLGVTVIGLAVAFGLAGIFAANIALGAAAMIVVGIAVIILSIGLMIFKASKFEMMDALTLGVTVVGLGIAFGLAGLAAPFIALGAGAMILASVAVIILGVGLAIFKASGFKLEDSLALGAAIGAVGVTMAAAGLLFPFIALGAVAMILASVALLPITGALAIFKASGWKKSDNSVLEGALGAVMNGFLGGPMPGGLLAGIKFAVKAAARAVLLLVTVPPMILAGIALIAISKGLSIFKKSGFNKKDGDNIEYMLGSVVKAFGIVTDTERQKKMGFNVNPWDLYLGIQALSGAGRVLAGLAAGVQAWANLEVNEFEVINGGTKDAKLVIKNKRQLTKADFENAAFGMAQVITAISKPFADVGRLEKGKSSGNPLLDAVFGGGFVSGGIKALSRAGGTLVSLAAGVQAWANLEVTEFEVIGAGTKEAKIVPKSIRKMTPVDFALASMNIGMVVGFLAKEFAKVGKMESDSSGWFSGGFVSKGIKSLGGLGDNLLSITDVILKLAAAEITEFEVINAGTKDAKIVPKSTRKMTDGDFMKAATQVGKITGFLARQMAKIGKMEDNSSGWFSGGYVSKGIKALSGLGGIISSVTDSVLKIAKGEVVQMEVINGKMVPKSVRKIKSSDFILAGLNIDSILGIMVNSMATLGMKIMTVKPMFNLAKEEIPKISKIMTQAASPIEKWAKMQDAIETSAIIGASLNSIYNIFDPELNPNISKKSWYFSKLTTNLVTMAENLDDFKGVADNFERIEKSMKLTQGHINGMDLQKLTMTDSMMRSIAAMSKNPEAIAQMVGDTMEKSFEELIEALKELSSSNAPAPATDGGGGDTGGGGGGAAPSSGPAPKAPRPPKSLTAGQISKALVSALSSTTLSVKVKP